MRKVSALKSGAHARREQVAKVSAQPFQFIMVHQQVPIAHQGPGVNDGALQAGRIQVKKSQTIAA